MLLLMLHRMAVRRGETMPKAAGKTDKSCKLVMWVIDERPALLRIAQES